MGNGEARRKNPTAPNQRWFSRLHETDREHGEAVALYRSEHGPEARKRKAKERELFVDALGEKKTLLFKQARLEMIHLRGHGHCAEARRLEDELHEGVVAVHATSLEEDRL